MPTNNAAWLLRAQALKLEVKSAPYTPPKANEIVIKSRAVAMNPVDWIIKDRGSSLAFPWIKYPFIIGCDVAGEVVEVGKQAAGRFKIGDRVVGYPLSIDKERNNAAEGAFQTYVVMLDYMTAHLPNSMSFETASVIPLGFATASCGFYQTDMLAMQLPSLNPKPTGKTVIIWGGATSVGCNAIQLAKASGYDVFTTCSPRNFDLCKRLGADEVFDYNSKTVIPDLIRAFKGKISAGALTMGAGAADACFDILHKVEGNKFIAMATFPLPSPYPTKFVTPQVAYQFVSWQIGATIKTQTRGIKWKFIMGSTLAHNEVGKAVFTDYLGPALAENKFIPAPDPIVAGKGLESIEGALAMQKKGVSAKKVVVTL